MASHHKPDPEIAAMATAVGLYMYVKDHTGARFLGIAEMAEAWGINVELGVHCRLGVIPAHAFCP